MKKVVGLKFNLTGKAFYYEPGEDVFDIGDRVIVEGAEGEEYATVSIPVIEIDETKYEEKIQPIKRRANEEDLERINKNLEDEKEAFGICLEKIFARELPMKLIGSEYTFSRNKLIFYFTADGRVDFRELVKDLAAVFHTRIELRQIGVRDETKILGGIGVCGRPFCCKTFLKEFAPVSIKMAKEQRLSLNPTKISGACGRLMCCLKNEEETYEYLNKTLPVRGDLVTLNDGRTGSVYSVNALKQLITVLFEENDEKEMVEYRAEDIKKTKRGHRKKNEDDRKDEGAEEELAKLLED